MEPAVDDRRITRVASKSRFLIISATRPGGLVHSFHLSLAEDIVRELLHIQPIVRFAISILPIQIALLLFITQHVATQTRI